MMNNNLKPGMLVGVNDRGFGRIHTVNRVTCAIDFGTRYGGTIRLVVKTKDVWEKDEKQLIDELSYDGREGRLFMQSLGLEL